MHVIGIVLLFLADLNGSKDILSNKYALTVFSIRQRGGGCQMRCRIVGNERKSEVGSMEGEGGLDIPSLNSHL